ncbi:putative ATPase/DNA-binding SARP family transcriptional activator [Actinomadura coerulea]|uniref:Putative ATPase/DNA-binding SARP family transcriptional activator n=1 Tax=Actinomadura coerulea TaxID=46159 RepID=A0A7X0G6K4_9ACTN|nr:BTAD domain-containing putative transcriptional regulator [Actinomadura coerulea]MBB6400445.1 putative ATPase/DNA-binding SARP family transcriptional activator [Actinomadura coerulea]GGQ07330.1 SARP family transcriptional regulator [Actinomadura coerulea]
MRFGVLGPLAVWTADGTQVAVRGLKVRALLADLLVQDGRPVSADRLIDDLWGPARPADPAGALQVKVSQLRRALEDAEPGGRELVVYQAPGYLLRVGPERVDAGRFAALAARVREAADPRTRAALLTDALALWRGPAYAPFGDEPFARAAVTRLEEQRLTAVEDLVEARLALGEHTALVGELRDLVARHPLRERLHAALMRALYGAGRQNEALDSFGELRDRLREDLGLDPSPELADLRQAILTRDPGLAPGRPRTNLPAPPGELIGREEAVREVRALLEAYRLVTLTGPGGVGKTRLALEIAARVLDGFPDGVWSVELGGHDRPDALADAVAATLGVRDAGGGAVPAADRVARALRGRRLLLVLDNCEHLIGPAAELAHRLLAAAPRVRILTTSREPLGVGGEAIWTVPPLEPPDAAGDAGPAALRESSAVRLFEARAAAASPGFALTADNAGAVAAICRRLDGIPLALELAATRVRALGAEELAARLHDRFRLLSAGRRDVPRRQRTLRAAIDWSWDLLTGPERAVLRRLSVHAGGCSLEAAEAVCAGGGLAVEDVAELLSRLVDRSMVVVAGDALGHRYRLLESVAAYCAERLREAGESEHVRALRDGYYTEFAERAAERLRGPDQRRWLQRLDVEHANLRAAIESTVRHERPDLALRLVNAMAWYWFLRGRLSEGRRLLDLALTQDGTAPSSARAAAGAWRTGMEMLGRHGIDRTRQVEAALEPYDSLDDPVGRARAEWFLAEILLGGADSTTGERLAQQALAAFREAGDRWGMAATLTTLAHYALIRGDLAACARHTEQGAAIFDALGDRWGRLRAADLLGRLAEIRGDQQGAARLLREGLRLAEDLGIWTQVSYLLSGLGRIAMMAGDLAGAERFHEKAMRLATEQSNRPGEVFAELGLAMGARRQGRLDVAEKLLRDALDWQRSVGFDPGVALTLSELGFVAEQRGDAETARREHLEALATARRTGDPRATALALEGLAAAHTLAGEHHLAARLLGAATAAREATGAPSTDVDRTMKALHAALGEQTLNAELQEGRTSDPRELAERKNPEARGGG